MIGLLRALRRMISGGTTNEPEGTLTLRLYVDTRQGLCSRLIGIISIDLIQRSWRYRQVGQDISNSDTCWEKVDAASFLSTILTDGMSCISSRPGFLTVWRHSLRDLTHQQISFLKSAIRILGYVLLPVSLWLGAVVLVISEGVGIVEEIGH